MEACHAERSEDCYIAVQQIFVRELAHQILTRAFATCAILAFSEGKTPTVASIARFLQLPHETTRRYLQTIVRLGLLTKNGRAYKPTKRAGASPAEVPRRIERLFSQAAKYFSL